MPCPVHKIMHQTLCMNDFCGIPCPHCDVCRWLPLLHTVYTLTTSVYDVLKYQLACNVCLACSATLSLPMMPPAAGPSLLSLPALLHC